MWKRILLETSIVTVQTRHASVEGVPVWTDDYSDLFSLLIRSR